jgi:orotate phosphoribosyltransferase
MLNVQGMVANALLEIRAVHFNDVTPYTLTSNTRSPVYIDCRKLISYPRPRSLVLALARLVVDYELRDTRFDVIAGGETAGIPYAAWLAQELNLPMIYVRKAPKGFGRGSQIEGDLAAGARVLLFEDLLFDAQSKINFCQGIRQAGAEVHHTLVVFNYGNPASLTNLNAHQITLHALTDWPALLEAAQGKGYFSAQQVGVVKTFLADPAAWSQAYLARQSGNA